MGLFDWFRSRKMSSLDLLKEVYGAKPSKSGVPVNWKTALGVTTVLACCRVIADGIAQVPWRVYQDTGSGRSIAADHPVHGLLYRRPNPWQTSFSFRETMMFHTLLVGNAFVFLNRVGSRREIREMVLLDPSLVEVEQLEDMTIEYRVSGRDGIKQRVPSEAIWHVRGPSWNGWMGMETVKLAREAIGLAIGTEDTHSSLHKNGAKVPGVLTVEGKLSPEQYEKLFKWVKENFTGADANNPMILDNGAKWTPLAMTGVDAQHLETRKYQIEEICRAFRVMPIMVGYSDKTATYASAESMFLAHVIHTLSPWYERLEQSADINLLSEADRKAGYYTKFTPNALMRGAAKDRAEFYAKALGSGGSPAWMTPNEVRSLEEMDRIDGGDELFVPTNTGNADGKTTPAV